MATLDEWLAQIKLHRYGAAMKEEGYDELDFLRAVGESDIEEMTTSIGMKKPHAIVFKAAWKQLVHGNVTSEGAAGAALAASSVVPPSAAVAVSYPQAVPYDIVYTTEFTQQSPLPTVILSYCTHTDEGKGKEHVWAIANILKDAGITSFHGYMVRGGDQWEEEWFGIMPSAKFGVVMISEAFLKSKPCVKELRALLKQGIPIIAVVFDRTA